jgi:Tol biopolymer transport system component
MKTDSFSTLRKLTLRLVFTALAVGHTAAQTPPRSKSASGSEPPIVEASIFAEGIISTRDYESSASFTPDGKTVYFVKSTPDLSLRVILVSHFDGRRWSVPEVAPFSGQYTDTDPCLSPDGTKLFFASRRPIAGATPKADADIWMVERTGAGWGEAQHLDAPVNSESQETSPSPTADGTLYFSSNRAGGKGTADIYRTRLVAGKYTTPENLGESINTPSPELQVFVTPDERVLIFAGAGRADSQGGVDLYLSRWEGGAWSKPANLGSKINSPGADTAPRISPDGRSFFWTSTRGYGFADQQAKRLTYRELSESLRSARNSLGDIYRIDINELHIKQ